MKTHADTHTNRADLNIPAVEVISLYKTFHLQRARSIKELIFSKRNRSESHPKEQFVALNGVSISIHPGTTVGLIGANGSGKSTLLALIGGILKPNSGTVRTSGKLAALLELGTGFHPDLTGKENIYLNSAILGMKKHEIEGKFDEIVDFAGVHKFINTQVKFYSSGMYSRLAFAVAVCSDPDILLIDEVLAVGDEYFAKKCLNKIRQFQQDGKTIIIVSHNLGQIEEFCTRAVVLQQGNIIYDGTPKTAIAALKETFTNLEQVDLSASIRAKQIQEEEHLSAQQYGTITNIYLQENSANSKTAPPHKGATSVTIHPGSTLQVRVNLQIRQYLEFWSLGLAISTPSKQCVLATSTHRAQMQHEPLQPGEYTVTFTLPSLYLAPNTYSITCALHNKQYIEISQKVLESAIICRGDERSFGAVYSPICSSVTEAKPVNPKDADANE